MARTTRRGHLRIASTGGAAALLAACSLGGQSGTDTTPPAVTGPVTVDVAWPDPSVGWGLYVATEGKKAFEDRNPGVTLNFSTMGNQRSQVLTFVLGRSAAGTPPHVVFMDIQLPTFYVTKNILVPLDGYISKDKESRKEEFAAPLWEAFSIKGKQYGLPNSGGPPVLYYNKSLVSGGSVAPPNDSWTLGEHYREAAVKLTRRGGEGATDVFGTSIGNFRDWLWSNGGEILDAGMTKYVMDQPAAVEGLQLFQDFRYKFRCATTPQDNQKQGPSARFGAGELALLPSLRSGSYTFVGPNTGIALHPKGKAGRKFNMPGNGQGLVQQPTPAQARVLDAAYKAAAWYSGAEFEKAVYKAGLGGVVARLSVLKSEEYLNSVLPREWNEYFAKGVNDLKVWPKLSNWPDIDELLATELGAFQNGQEPAVAVAARLAPIVTGMLRDAQRG